MPGKTPKPTALKLVGPRSHHKENHAEPKPKRAIPKCPTWLTKDQKKIFKTLAPLLYELGLLTEIDQAILTQFCVSYDRWIRLEEQLSEMRAWTFVTENGYQVPVPEIGMAKGYEKQARETGAKLGLSPADRTRIQVKGIVDPEDSFEVYLRGKNRKKA